MIYYTDTVKFGRIWWDVGRDESGRLWARSKQYGKCPVTELYDDAVVVETDDVVREKVFTCAPNVVADLRKL